jgi:regulator of replication initiation timing
MEIKQLTEEEIQSLRDLSFRQSNLINALGQLEYQITLLENNKSALKERIQGLEEENKTLGQALTEKYGNGSLNLETGEITIEAEPTPAE